MELEDHGRCHFLREWNDWDYSIHDDPAQVNRQARAVLYPFSFEVDYDNEIGIFSSTTDIPFYVTTLRKCNCYDFQERNLPCKHIYCLAVELGIIEIIDHNSAAYKESIRSSGNIDNHPDQRKRIKSAKSPSLAPVSIDRENKTAVFQGSAKKPYTTTLESCTCRDWITRRLPCKHMYRLRMELGLMDEQNAAVTADSKQ